MLYNQVLENIENKLNDGIEKMNNYNDLSCKRLVYMKLDNYLDKCNIDLSYSAMAHFRKCLNDGIKSDYFNN